MSTLCWLSVFRVRYALCKFRLFELSVKHAMKLLVLHATDIYNICVSFRCIYVVVVTCFLAPFFRIVAVARWHSKVATAQLSGYWNGLP